MGKTMLASNLGTALGVGFRQHVLITDLLPALGSLDLLLNVQNEKTWLDLFPVVEELTPDQIELAVTEIRTGDFYILMINFYLISSVFWDGIYRW
ncbi:MAG: hypothetical protein U5K99_03810 [Anaerolineales bacterium]|nr:hypothetical protein [Anaerolineales bacterium]